jgi:hypothetical protein
MGIKKGASKDRVTQLKEKINGLTKSIERREITNIYDLGSQSLLNLKPFFDLYKDDYRGEICDLKYSIYQYYIKAISNDKEGALNAINSKEENINRIRLLIGDDEKKIDELEKISSSLENVGISFYYLFIISFITFRGIFTSCIKAYNYIKSISCSIIIVLEHNF